MLSRATAGHWRTALSCARCWWSCHGDERSTMTRRRSSRSRQRVTFCTPQTISRLINTSMFIIYNDVHVWQKSATFKANWPPILQREQEIQHYRLSFLSHNFVAVRLLSWIEAILWATVISGSKASTDAEYVNNHCLNQITCSSKLDDWHHFWEKAVSQNYGHKQLHNNPSALCNMFMKLYTLNTWYKHQQTTTPI